MDWIEFQELLTKAFLREPALSDWFAQDEQRERMRAVDQMIIEALANDPEEDDDVWA